MTKQWQKTSLTVQKCLSYVHTTTLKLQAQMCPTILRFLSNHSRVSLGQIVCQFMSCVHRVVIEFVYVDLNKIGYQTGGGLINSSMS